jgi:hypothetical protein
MVPVHARIAIDWLAYAFAILNTPYFSCSAWRRRWFHTFTFTNVGVKGIFDWVSTSFGCALAFAS